LLRIYVGIEWLGVMPQVACLHVANIYVTMPSRIYRHADRPRGLVCAELHPVIILWGHEVMMMSFVIAGATAVCSTVKAASGTKRLTSRLSPARDPGHRAQSYITMVYPWYCGHGHGRSEGSHSHQCASLCGLSHPTGGVQEFTARCRNAANGVVCYGIV
jgi:hypothetical protein